MVEACDAMLWRLGYDPRGVAGIGSSSSSMSSWSLYGSRSSSGEGLSSLLLSSSSTSEPEVALGVGSSRALRAFCAFGSGRGW